MYTINNKEELYILTKEYLDKLKANELPIKKFTKEQIALMNNINLKQFVLWYDSTLINCDDKSCRLVSNNSVVIFNNFAKDFSKQHSSIQGEKSLCRPLDFCVQFLGFTFCQALYLISEFMSTPSGKIQPLETKLSTEMLHKQIKDGRYIKAVTNKPAYSYLSDTRHIEPSVVKYLLHEDSLYVEVLTKGYNLAFPLFNDLNEIVGFELCGLLSNRADHRYKGSVVAEPYSCFYSVSTPTQETTRNATLYVFESAIDLTSFLSLIAKKQIVLPKGKTAYMISLRGLHYKILEKFINEHPDIDEVNICVDCDRAGQAFYEEAKSKVTLPTNNFAPFLQENNVKDWNELLTSGDKATLDLNNPVPVPSTPPTSFIDYVCEVDNDEDLPF